MFTEQPSTSDDHTWNSIENAIQAIEEKDK